MSRDRQRDWTFARRPAWLASHLFAGTLIVSFIWAGFWQLDRLDERQTENEHILERASGEPLTLAEAVGVSPEDLDYQRVVDHGKFVEDEVVWVVNRSQNGVGGDWVVGLFQADSGHRVLVNRGFVARSETAEPVGISGPEGTISGWFRVSQTKDGYFGALDTGEGERAPRLDVEAISGRMDDDGDLLEVWLQMETFETDAAESSGLVPDPVPLPPIDERNHLSYAMQWFSFALLGTVVYGLLMRKIATEPSPSDDLVYAEDSKSPVS